MFSFQFYVLFVGKIYCFIVFAEISENTSTKCTDSSEHESTPPHLSILGNVNCGIPGEWVYGMQCALNGSPFLPAHNKITVQRERKRENENRQEQTRQTRERSQLGIKQRKPTHVFA